MGDATTPSAALDIKEAKLKVQEYTGKITDNPAPPDEKYEEPIFAKEPPSSEIFGDNNNNNIVVTENRELHELHRSTNDPIDSQSNSTRLSVCERPAAGAGGSSANPAPVYRGRRHIRTTIFAENECNEYGLANGPAAGLGPQFEIPNENQEIFSIKGTRSIKINRHRDTVNVFPSGCMGIPQDALAKIPEDHHQPPPPLLDLSDSPKKDDDECNSTGSTPRSLIVTPREDDLSPKKASTDTTADGIYGEESPPVLTPRSITQNCSSYNSVQYRRSRPLSAVQRNPLTGVGYEDRDFIRQSTMKKRDGNPVLGQGYETKDLNNKSKKIPPGGYSRGLW